MWWKYVTHIENIKSIKERIEEEESKNQDKEEKSENDEIEGECRNGDELDDAVTFLMEFKGGGQL